MRQLSQMSGGYYENLDDTRPYSWTSQIRTQIDKTFECSVSDIHIDWQQFDCVVTPLQAPVNAPAIFNGSRAVIFGFVQNCTVVSH